MSQSPTYTAAQREDGSWGLQCPDGRIIGTAKTEAEAQFGVDVAIWKQENVVAGLLEALRYLFADYKQLADSGDAGNWSLENTDAGRVALAAIAKATGQ